MSVRTKKVKNFLQDAKNSLEDTILFRRTRMPAAFRRICVGTVLTKKDVEDTVVLQDTVLGIDHKMLKIKGIVSGRIANCHVVDVYIRGYFPSRQMEREKVLEMLGLKREPIIRCVGSRKNIITCKIIKGENPRRMRVDDVHMKGRTVVGLKVKCSICGKKCGVSYSRGEYLVKKHKAKKHTEEINQQTSRRTR